VKTLAGCIAVSLLLTWSSALAEPGFVLAPAVGTPRRLVLSGRLLRERPSGGSSVWSRNLRQLGAAGWEHMPVRVDFLGKSAELKTGEGGDFEAVFEPPAGGAPFPTGLQWVDVQARGASARAWVEILPDEAPFLVISDFDDTVAVTNVTSKRGLIQAALFEDANTQPVVQGMPELYQCLRAGKASAPGFALVSGSPIQYIPRHSAFLARHRFPFMGLYLRELSPSTLSGYKQPVIRKLLAQLPHKVLLFGDSGEKDPEVYAEIRRDFPDRVLDIYIRQVTSADPKQRFEGMHPFHEPREAALEALRKGYLSQACFEAKFGEEQQP
jgi:phosphatidate phosphatase APP1